MPNRPKRNWAGVRQGHLTMIESTESNPHGQALWKCLCDCGSTTSKSVVFLNNGGRCCSRACPLQGKFKHKAAPRDFKTKEYRAWVDMKQRCTNPNARNYKYYGGRGISVCDEWVENFNAFLSYMGYAPEGKRISIDRIDNDGNYEPGNVRWATPYQQVMNRRNTKC